MTPDRYIHDSLTLMDFMQTGENEDVRPWDYWVEANISLILMGDYVKHQEWDDDE